MVNSDLKWRSERCRQKSLLVLLRLLQKLHLMT